MKHPKPRLNPKQHAWVRDWWSALQPQAQDAPQRRGAWAKLGRGARAQLRRCASIDELLVQPAVLLLAQHLIAHDDGGALPDIPLSYERIAWVAGVLAHVKHDLEDGESLAKHLGNAGNNKERAAMSELRFKSMQRCMVMSDLSTHWRRAVQLADCKADVARLADDLLAWQIELDYTLARASDGIRFHWAFDYYLSVKEQAVSEEIDTTNSASV